MINVMLMIYMELLIDSFLQYKSWNIKEATNKGNPILVI
jgi:hypothetical protein